MKPIVLHGRKLLALAVCVVVCAIVIPSESQAQSYREKRLEKEAEEAKYLKRKMRRKYGAVCPKGTQPTGGFPPDFRAMHCKYPTSRGDMVRHGKYYKWWPDGSVRVEGQYWQGKKHGVWTSYLVNGTPARQDTYYGGQRTGSVRFDRDGKKQPILNGRQAREAAKSRRKTRERSDF